MGKSDINKWLKTASDSVHYEIVPAQASINKFDWRRMERKHGIDAIAHTVGWCASVWTEYVVSAQLAGSRAIQHSECIIPIASNDDWMSARWYLRGRFFVKKMIYALII